MLPLPVFLLVVLDRTRLYTLGKVQPTKDVNIEKIQMRPKKGAVLLLLLWLQSGCEHPVCGKRV